jgi:hypothetical protein
MSSGKLKMANLSRRFETTKMYVYHEYFEANRAVLILSK